MNRGKTTVIQYHVMNLAYRMRPNSLAEFVGQEHLLATGKVIRKTIESKQVVSMIFWGPPGSGKTTLAYILARELSADFHARSAVESGKGALTEIIQTAKRNAGEGKKTILFLDEIHRWNKSQQDALLPHVETGLITLIGATTENPSFEVISALLSRCRVFVLKGLEHAHLKRIMSRALKDTKDGMGKWKKTITRDAEELLVNLSGGDARILLNALEIAVVSYREKKISSQIVMEIFQTRSGGLYDKKGEEHYNAISAFIKSMRAGNVDAALYYLARMVEAGENPLFIARRMVVFASEDVGMAQPTALVVANEVFRACETIGYPECAINLAHGAVYLASARKDRSAYDAYFRAVEDVKRFPNLTIPLSLRNAPTKLMKELDYGKGYEKYTQANLLPDALREKTYYTPRTHIK